MRPVLKKTICILLLALMMSLLLCTLTACNSGRWVHVTYYYNDELLEQEKYWEYAFYIHGNKHDEDLDWDEDRGKIMDTVKRLCNKLYNERGKKVFFGNKEFLEGKGSFDIYDVYSYSKGKCQYNRETNVLEKMRDWVGGLLKSSSKTSYVLVARDEPSQI